MELRAAKLPCSRITNAPGLATGGAVTQEVDTALGRTSENENERVSALKAHGYAFSSIRRNQVSTCARLPPASSPRIRPAVVLEGDAVGLWSAANSGIERVDGGHLLRREREAEDVEGLGDSRWLGRLRNRPMAVLQMPAQHHLDGRLAVLAGDLEQRRVREGGLLAAPVGTPARSVPGSHPPPRRPP